MKIAYGCNGEGFGHVSRLTTRLNHLENKHEVGVFLPHSVLDYFHSKTYGFHRAIHKIPGLHFVQVHGRIDFFKSIILNLPFILTFPLSVFRLSKHLKKEKYQVVISDFEPHMAWAGFLAGIPVIQLNHPGVMKKIQDKEPVDLTALLVAYLMEGPWNYRVIVSFFDGDVGPLIRPSLLFKRHKTKDKGFLVFNLKESYKHKVMKVLKKFPDLKWKLFPSKTEDFDKALRHCTAVVTSAGHQIIAEALFLKKPVLAIPQEGQAEQVLNANKLEESGKGIVGSLQTLDQDLRHLLMNLKHLKKNKLPKWCIVEDGTMDLLKKLEKFFSKIQSSGTQANLGNEPLSKRWHQSSPVPSSPRTQVDDPSLLSGSSNSLVSVLTSVPGM